MAATLEGTFKIIDGASRDLKKMRDQAVLTDVAFSKLGATMDGLGSRQRAQGIERTATATRGLRQEASLATRNLDAYNRKTKDADRNTAGFGGRLKLVARGLKDFGGELFKLARPAGMVFGFGTAIGLAGQAVAQLAGGIVALGPRLADLTGLLAPAIAGAAGLATSMLEIKSAFTQIGTAMKGGPAGLKAFREMGAAGRQVVGDLKGMRPVLLQIKQAATGGIFVGLHKSLLDIRRVLPTLEPMLRSYSRMLGGELARGTARITAPGFMGDIRNIMGQGRGVSQDMIRGVLNLVSALRHIAVAARPFTEWLSKTILGWTQFIDKTARAGRESGRLSAFFERTQKSAEGLGKLVKDLWITLRNLGRDARGLGEELYQGIGRAADSWAKITSTPQNRMRLIRDFNAMGAGLKAMANLAGALGAAIFKMGSGGGLARTATALQGMVDPLQKILMYFADTFGPPAAKALTDITKLLSDLGSSSGPLVTILNVIDSIANGLDAIVRHLGPFKGFVGTLVGGLLTARLLQKIGLLTIAWRGVAAEATQAAGAQVAAMSVGAGGMGAAARGPGIYLGGPLSRGAAGGRGFLGSMIRGRPAAPAGATFRGAAGLGAMEAAGLTAGRGTMLRGAAGGLARGAGAVAGRFVLPILAMQALFAAGTAGGSFTNRLGAGARSVGIGGNPLVSAGSGALIGGGIGSMIAPGLGTAIGAGIGGAIGLGAGMYGSRTPAGVDMVAESQRRLAAGMQQASGRTGLDRLNRELIVYQTQLKTISYLNTDAAKKYRASLQSEIQARAQLVQQMNQQQRQVGMSQGARVAAGIAQDYTRAGGGAPGRAVAMQDFREQLRLLAGPGPRRAGARRNLSQLMLNAAATTGDPAYLAQVQALARSATGAPGAPASVRGTSIFTGTRAERGGLLESIQQPPALRAARGQAALTPLELDLVASLEASGIPRAKALELVRSNSGRPIELRRAIQAYFAARRRRTVARQQQRAAAAAEMLGSQGEITPAPSKSLWGRIQSGIPSLGSVGSFFGHAAGGRLAGSGFHDTVPAMLAPGEMVVNRHQERAVNSLLAGSGHTLEGMTDAVTRHHSQSFATGGRAPAGARGPVSAGPMGQYGLKAGITGIGNAVLTRYPGLAVTSTTTGNHAANSYHYKGMAVDLGGTGENMHNAAVWISRNLGAGLLEGIHNTGLSVKNGANVKPGFWGASTWAGHRDHIHLAAGTGGTGAATGAATGAGGAGARRPGRPAGALSGILGGGGANQLFGVGGIQFSAGRRGTGAGGGGGGGGGAPAAPGGGSNRQIGKAMMLAHGWGTGQWPALNALWTGESGWRTTADNPTSDAYGIPQALPGSKMASAGSDWKTNPRTQIQWGLDYISGRYGSPSGALSAWQARSPHWYNRGGRAKWGGWHQMGMDRTFDTPTVIGVGEKGRERVQVTPTGKGGGGAPVTIHATFNIRGGEPGRVKREVEMAMEGFAQKLEQLGYHGGDE